MSGRTFKTEAVVLRSIRYGEADRILHLYSPTEGRISAMAKGVRKARSRFGGRLEPFFRLHLVLHRGRGDLATVSAAETLAAYPSLRSSSRGLADAASACAVVGKLFDVTEPSEPAYNLLCRYLYLIDSGSAVPDDPGSEGSDRARAVAFRLKLALAAGFAPELSSCAQCGGTDHVDSFSGRAGGIVCSSCHGGGFSFSGDAHRFMVHALAQPLAEIEAAEPLALRQADRAISEVLEHHAHVQLRSAA